MWGNFGVILIFVGTALGIQVQLFNEANYFAATYDFDESLDANTCHNVAGYGRGVAASVLTNTCIFVYEPENCTGRSVRIEAPGRPTLNRQVYSFRTCKEGLGGKNVQLDLSSDALLARYKSVCGCVNIPTRVTSRMKSINNYGNCITIYSGENCEGQKRDVQAGVNADSEDLTKLPYFVRSVSACGASPACIKLQSTIFKFVLQYPEDETGHFREIELAPNTTYFNDGSATITQEYRASKSHRQTFSVAKSPAILNIDKVTIDHNYLTEVDIPDGADDKSSSTSTSISEALRRAYVNIAETLTSDDVEEKAFEVRETIQIPPCIAYEVSSSLNILEKVTIPYWIYAKVEGTISGKEIKADELEQHVKGMEFVKVNGEFSAIFRTMEMVTVSVGVDTSVSGEGKKIDDCEIVN